MALLQLPSAVCTFTIYGLNVHCSDQCADRFLIVSVVVLDESRFRTLITVMSFHCVFKSDVKLLFLRDRQYVGLAIIVNQDTCRIIFYVKEHIFWFVVIQY